MKRFVDTQLWQKEWFMELEPENKCAFMFLTSQCDSVGVWCPNFKLAEMMIGQKINWSELPKKCNGNIKILENGKWFLIDFCRFQYGELSENCKPHVSYIKLLNKHGLLNKEFEGYSKGIATLKEKEKEQEKDMEQEEEKEMSKNKAKINYAENVFLTEKQYNILVHDYGKDITVSAIEILSNYKCSKNKKYESDYHALLTWAIKEAAGKDRQLVKAEIAKRRDENEAQKKVMSEIKAGKLEKRLSPAELSELTKGITKKSNFLNGGANQQKDHPWGVKE